VGRRWGLEHRPEIDALLGAIRKRHRKRVRSDNLEVGHPMDELHNTLALDELAVAEATRIVCFRGLGRG
jgi:hypothetical protein